MKTVYVRKIDKQCLTHQISTPTNIVEDFFLNKSEFECEGKTSHFVGTVTLLPATDWRFGGDIKNIIKHEGTAEIGDLLVFSKQTDKFILELVKKTDGNYLGYDNFFDDDNPRHTIISLEDSSNSNVDQALSEIIDLNKQFYKLSTDSDYLFEQINSLNKETIEDLLDDDYSEESCLSENSILPVNTLRYVILKALSFGEKVDLSFIDLVKKCINSGNNIEILKYFGNKKIIDSFKEQKNDKFEKLWQEPYSICYVFFYSKSVRSNLKELANIVYKNVVLDLNLLDIDMKLWDFNGSRNNGSGSSYIAFFPSINSKAKNSYQLAIGFLNDKMSAGIWKGKKVDDNAHLEQNEMSEVNTYNEILEVFNKYKENFIDWNRKLLNQSDENEDIDDDSLDTDNVDIADNENRFREWMSHQISARGTIFTKSSIISNCSALHRVCKMMKIQGYEDMNSIFEITDPDVFYDVKTIIKNDPNYPSVNKACSNRFLSSALNLYEQYLDSINVVKENTEHSKYDKSNFLDEVFLSEQHYNLLSQLLEYKKNVVLQGAPGVGKTFMAKRLAYSLLGEINDDFIEMIQFHQSYSYEDFIMGYKPTDDGFELREGVFYKFCQKARNDSDNKYFFIIDEINRGNLSKIFGEVMMLMENDKRGQSVKLAYRNEYFSIPKNIYIIGMMNTADRSLAMIDYALRRRFSFFDVEPGFELPTFKKHLEKYIKDKTVIKKITTKLPELNKKISDPDNGLGKGFCIGHSYFCIKPVEGQTDEDWYTTIVDFEIAPLLDEYWWDNKDIAEDCRIELLR